MDPGYVHPKDNDLPDFTRDSNGRPKAGYRNPPGVSDVDAGFADYLGRAMFGHEYWETQRRRARRYERVKSAMRGIISLGCLGVSALISVAAILGLILLIRYLWGLM